MLETQLIRFKIVLASGKIVNASASKYPDLYKALKGGNNNFGVVARFDFKTFEQGKLWGGLIVYNYTNPREKLQRLQDFNTLSGAGGDPFATVTNVYSFTAGGPGAIRYIPSYVCESSSLSRSAQTLHRHSAAPDSELNGNSEPKKSYHSVNRSIWAAVSRTSNIKQHYLAQPT